MMRLLDRKPTGVPLRNARGYIVGAPGRAVGNVESKALGERTKKWKAGNQRGTWYHHVVSENNDRTKKTMVVIVSSCFQMSVDLLDIPHFVLRMVKITRAIIPKKAFNRTREDSFWTVGTSTFMWLFA